MANAPDADDLAARISASSPDVRPGLGSLGGIFTAVVEAPAPVVCVAWDMPFVSAGLVRALAEGLAEHDAVLPASDGRRGLEPLCAGYGPACREAIAASLDAGDLRAIGFHPGISVGILPLTDVGGSAIPSSSSSTSTPRTISHARTSCGGDTHPLHHRPKERRKDHADRGPLRASSRAVATAS